MAKEILKRRKIVKKGVLTTEQLFNETEIIIKGTSYMAYLIFVMSEIKLMYGIDSEDIMILLYINDLVYFNKTIKVNENEISLKKLIDKAFVKEIIISKKSVYELTEKSKKLVIDFHKLLINKDNFIGNNIVFETDISIKLKKILSNL